MKRKSILDQLQETCPISLNDLYVQFKEEIKDFFYKYDLYKTDNMCFKIVECLYAKEYMNYQQISDYAAINVKGVIKFVNRFEKFVVKLLDFPKYRDLKKYLNTTE